ncbi:MAG: hypothetical protein PHQ64_04545, partial [Bacilli bacterium]|nr:hypothetical protein [Bacilli bacterium]
IKKEELITLLINFLRIDFPDWENNIYLRNNFINFEIPDIINTIKVKNILKKYDISQYCGTKEEVLQLYKKASTQ